MSAPRRPSSRVRLALALGLVAACSPDRPMDPEIGPPPLAEGLAARAVAVRVDVGAGTVTVLDRSAPTTAARGGASFALLGANEIAATTSNVFWSTVGQFTPKKVRIRFDVAITNRSSVALLPPTFPTPPAGTTGVLLFPFATTLTAGNGAIDPSTDWDGAALNFFNDASCSSGGRSDCYRWEPYPAPFAAGSATAARTVGFDVDPTVQSFTTYVVLAADLTVPGAIVGTVSSPERGALGHVTVSLAPANRFSGTSNAGGYGFDNVSPGAYTVSLSGLPGYCFPVAAKPATVVSGATTTLNFSVQCPRIAFTSNRGGRFDVWTMNADGTGQTVITTAVPGNFAWEPAWSGDGSRIAFAGGPGDLVQLSSLQYTGGVGDIFAINPNGSNPVNLTNTGQEYEPNWSHDGTRLVFSSARDGNDPSLKTEIWVMNADGSGQIRISNDDYADLEAAWSPDGSTIAYARRNPDASSNEAYNPEIWLMNPDGSNQRRLTDNGTACGAASSRHPVWSPDGTRIAFYAHGALCGQVNIWVMNADGSNQTQLTNMTTGASFDPAWSPDGRLIAFARVTGSTAQPDIWVMNADGSNPVQLTTDAAADFQPTWEP